MTGQGLLDEDEMEAIEASNKPIKKSDFATRQFTTTKEFC